MTFVLFAALVVLGVLVLVAVLILLLALGAGSVKMGQRGVW